MHFIPLPDDDGVMVEIRPETASVHTLFIVLRNKKRDYERGLMPVLLDGIYVGVVPGPATPENVTSQRLIDSTMYRILPIYDADERDLEMMIEHIASVPEEKMEEKVMKLSRLKFTSRPSCAIAAGILRA